MADNWNNVKNVCCKPWLVLPAVYSDALSYGEQIAQFCSALNKVIENNNILPDFITELIKEYINGGAIGEVVRDILATYILNVKYPPKGITPAVGDGSADDTEAIQGCIDYAFNNGGMAVYFPSGSYLTQPLALKNKCTMFGYDRYNTRLVLKGGATKAMFTGDVDELTLTGIGFDGNMDIQVNNVNLFDVTVGSAIITNALLTDGYDLLKVVVNRDLQLDNVIFNHSVENSLVTSGDGYVQANNVIFKSVSALIGKNYVVLGCNNSILTEVKCEGASPNGVLITGNNNIVKMWKGLCLKAYTDNGVNNTVEVYTESELKKLNGSKTTSVDGDITENVGGVKTETIKGSKHVTAGSVTEDISGNKVVNSDTLFLNPSKPLKYNKEPVELNKKFKYVPFMYNETEYNVLVENDGLLNRSFINVVDYGAKGDGITDDTEAIQKAINENAPTETTGEFLGCDIFFPSGKYVISNTIELPAFINLIGEGRGQTMLYMANAVNKPLIKTKGYDNFIIDKHARWYITNKVPQLCGVKNMILFGNKWNNTYDVLVQLYGCKITFENVYFYGYSGWAIYQEWGDGVGEDWVLNYDKMSENIFTDCYFFEGDKGIFQSERVNDVSYSNIFMGRIMDIGADIDGTSYFNYAHFYDCNRNGTSDYALEFSAQGKFNLIIESMHIKPGALFNGYFQDINAECYLNENIDIQLGITNSNVSVKVNGTNEKETTVYVTPGKNNIYNIVQGGSYGRIFIEGISDSILNVTSNKDVHLAQGSAFTNVTGNAIGETVNPGSGVDNVWYPGKG